MLYNIILYNYTLYVIELNIRERDRAYFYTVSGMVLGSKDSAVKRADDHLAATE